MLCSRSIATLSLLCAATCGSRAAAAFALLTPCSCTMLTPVLWQRTVVLQSSGHHSPWHPRLPPDGGVGLLSHTAEFRPLLPACCLLNGVQRLCELRRGAESWHADAACTQIDNALNQNWDQPCGALATARAMAQDMQNRTLIVHNGDLSCEPLAACSLLAAGCSYSYSTLLEAGHILKLLCAADALGESTRPHCFCAVEATCACD